MGIRNYPSEADDSHRPLLWLGGQAVYAAHFLVLVFAVSTLATTAAMALRFEGYFSGLIFGSGEVLRGQVWRVVTYGLVNPPSLLLVIDLAMLFWFGRELEKFFGRRTFLKLYGGLYLFTPLLFTLIGLWRPMHLVGESAAFALFIAFATLYPNVGIFFGLAAKWVAAALVGIYSLIHLANRDATGLVSLWSTAGFAHAFVRYEQGRLSLPSLAIFRRRRERARPERPAAKPRADGTPAEVDAILDKIARTGLGSLTPQERAQLDRARADLLRRGPASRR